MFAQVDTARTGQLTAEDFKRVYALLIEHGYSLKGFAQVISEIDKSSDGTINLNEFVAWVKNMVCNSIIVNAIWATVVCANHIDVYSNVCYARACWIDL